MADCYFWWGTPTSHYIRVIEVQVNIHDAAEDEALLCVYACEYGVDIETREWQYTLHHTQKPVCVVGESINRSVRNCMSW